KRDWSSDVCSSDLQGCLLTPHGCSAAKLAFALTWVALSQQIRHIDKLLRDLAQALSAVHRHPSQHLISLVFAHAAALHQDSLGALDELSLFQLQICLC